MTGCDFPVMTQADVAALGEIEAVIDRARVGTIAALDSAGRMLTHDRGRHVPNRARHVPRTLRNDLSLFSDIHWHETLSQGAVHLMSSACVRAWRAGRLTPSSLRPRRVTAGGLAIVRGRR